MKGCFGLMFLFAVGRLCSCFDLEFLYIARLSNPSPIVKKQLKLITILELVTTISYNYQFVASYFRGIVV